MRQLIIIVILAALGYYGWGYYQEHKDSLPISIPFLNKSADDSAPPPEPAAPSRPGVPTPVPVPQFVSKVIIPDAPAGTKPMAPPGSYYMLERVSVETPSGVSAVVPGDTVKLLQRKPGGKLRVTINQADFEVKEEQVTQDPEIAQVAEKREYDKRFQRR
jgi:hypothetical protein